MSVRAGRRDRAICLLACVLGSALLLTSCANVAPDPFALSTAAVATTTASVQLASVRARDAETAAQIASNGSLLYSADINKGVWDKYCHISHMLANQGNFREAVREASKSFFLGQGSGNPFAMAHAARDLAYAYSLAGDLDNARRWAEAALRYTKRTSSTRDTSGIIAPAHKIIGDIELRRGHPALAVAAYEQAIAVGSDRLKSEARAAMANAEIANRNFERARQLFRQADSGAEASVTSVIKRAEAELALAEGKSADALRLFNASFAASDEYNRVWSLRGAALAQKRLGEIKAAIENYKLAVTAAATLRARFRSEEFKTGFFGQLQTIYDEATELLIENGAASEALAVSEQGRARAMLDMIRGRVQLAGTGTGNAVVDPVGRAQTVSEIQASLADREALVVYHVLNTKTFAWTVTRGSSKVAKLNIGAAGISAKVRQFRALIEKQSPAVNVAGSELYTLLVEPVKLPDGFRVVFVPHKALHLLPFQALHGPKGWLVQERAVAAAPSASVYAAMQNARTTTQTGLLALGNPASMAGDPPLPGAESEVKKISAIVKGSETFIGKDATKVRFMSRAPANGIVHLAAHSIVDELDPLYSIVRLASSPEGGGDLEAHEVYRMRLTGTRIVVLSACDSGSGRISAGDEFWGFQRTFLGAGARTLLLTHWPVYDDSTAQLMERFYVHLQKEAPAEALRKAQIEVIQSGKHAAPVHWASFMLVGSPS
jgi:CHAT domain-containing protein/predicted negative regulator of RcsB-dependent stress response